MTIARYVQIGRVLLFEDGENAGKLATVLDVVDQNRVIVDGPKDLTGVSRQVVNLRQTALTDLVVTLPRNAGEVALRKAITEQGVLTKWNSSAWAQKLARRSTRANLTDFDRFKVVVARRKRADAVRREFSKLKSAAIKSKKL